jgi:hypothetical protein
MTTKQIFEAALSLPDESKATLAERLVADLASHVEPEVERAHLKEATRRRDEILSGKVQALDGETVMARARQIVGG